MSSDKVPNLDPIVLLRRGILAMTGKARIAWADDVRDFFEQQPQPPEQPSPASAKEAYVDFRKREGIRPGNSLSFDQWMQFAEAFASHKLQQTKARQADLEADFDAERIVLRGQLEQAQQRIAELEGMYNEQMRLKQGYADSMRDEIKRAEQAEAERDQLRGAVSDVLNDTALQAVAGWYESIRNLRAAVLTPPAAGEEG